MEYKDFLECIKERVSENVRGDYKVALNHVVKNNGCEMDGIIIMQEGQYAAPAIYINSGIFLGGCHPPQISFP